MRTAALLLLCCSLARSHPSVSVVQDSRGNIYYSDLTHVWMIAPDGARSIAVRNVHTHELALDAQDNLYGEHLWYIGGTPGRWMHYVWKRSRDGRIDTIITPRSGFRTGYSFVRDSIGTMYWADRSSPLRIALRRPDGRVTYRTSEGIRSAGWLHSTANGTVYFIGDGALIRSSPDGTFRRLTNDLRDAPVTGAVASGDHALMGLWSSRTGDVYVASPSSRYVKRISPSGTVTVADRSTDDWSPSGGLIDRSGTLWVLEFSPSNAVRLRRTGGSGEEGIF